MRRLWKIGCLAFTVLIAVVVAFSGFTAGPELYRVLIGYRVYETVPPELPPGLSAPALLVFTKTNGFRHEEAIPAANAAIERMGERRGWSVFITENGATFHPDYLRRFSATVWNNTSGDTLNAGQKSAFRAYMEDGGGFVGIHGAGGDFSYDWRWYVETLLRAQFSHHPIDPQFQEALLRVEDRGHPATQHLQEEWIRTGEWYSFVDNPRESGSRILATLDESTFNPGFLWMEGMGDDHPVIWRHCVGQGRAFYSALGHQASAYEEPRHVSLLEGAIAWAAGLEGEPCGPGRNASR